MTHPVAILIVNDGRASKAGRGIDFWLDRLAQSTAPHTYRIYLWNNALTDGALCARLGQHPAVTYLEAAPYERLAHGLAVPLQRLYTRARDEGVERLVTFTPDAYPIRQGWLPALQTALDAGMALAGIWYHEARASSAPSIHPSCLATTVNFVEQHHLRFDRLAAASDAPQSDLLAHFTAAAQAANLPIQRLHCGNDHTSHPEGASIYGDLICFQGAVDEQPHNEDATKLSNGATGSPGHTPLFQAASRARSLVNQARARLTSTLTWRTDYAKMLSPVALADLHPVPVGWQITGPTFIGVGAPKCGTSWWYQLLLEHPQVVPNRVKGAGRKELFYFTHFQQQPLPVAAIAHYQQFFAAPPGAIVGEFTPNYLAYPNCLEQIARATPDTKILVMLRNPIDRLLSHLNHLHRNRAKWFRTLPADVLKLVHHYPIYCEAALHSLYAVGLRRLFRYFAPDQVLVLQYERCRQSPAAELARTYRFLGMPDDYLPANLQRVVNEIPYQLPRYNPEERKFLVDYFADDVQQTLALCPEIDLGLWPDFISTHG